MLNATLQRSGGHKPVGPGVGPHLRRTVLPLSATEPRSAGDAEAEPSLVTKTEEGGALETLAHLDVTLKSHSTQFDKVLQDILDTKTSGLLDPADPRDTKSCVACWGELLGLGMRIH
ncbi:hypothetical protein NDU88_006406 [Pleurodeles waltl]|uniref:Uncharacterized protein n=1 Tax=Pleurodeles waltl TaxID=8319 RepID=A0AAV7MCS4_PLEWA|nr:hypothetical protein NDU88_006406 [Pleurodeles waltl]